MKAQIPDPQKASSPRVAQALAAWMVLRVSGPGADTPRLRRIASAQALTNKDEALNGLARGEQKLDNVLATLQETVLGWTQESVAEQAQLARDVAATEKRAADAQVDLARAQGAQARADERQDKDCTEAPKLDVVMTVLQEQRETVVLGANKVGVHDAQGVYKLLKQSLLARKASGNAGSRPEDVVKALAFLKGFTPPPAFMLVAPKADAPLMRIDVID